MPKPKALVQGQGLLTFRNVPWDSSQEHFAGVDRVLVVSGRQLPTPSAGCFIHSLNKHKQHSVQDHLFPTLPQVSKQIPVFHSYRFSRAAAATGSCPDSLFFCQQVDPESGLCMEKGLICCKLLSSHIICTEATYVPSQKHRTITMH